MLQNIAADDSDKFIAELNLTYHYSAGKDFSFFFKRLLHKEIFGVRCPQCNSVYLPPRPFCGRCNVLTSDWVKVGPRGTIRALSEVHLPILDPATGKDRKVPYTMVLVQLDGADSFLHHVIHGESNSKVEIDQRVEVVFAKKMQGRISDIIGFRVIENQEKPTTSLVLKAIDTQAKPLIIKEELHLPFQYSIGSVGKTFFSYLKEKKLYALSCNKCGGHNLPPARRCHFCQSDDQQWFEATLTGVVQGVAKLSDVERPHLPRDVFGFALVQLDGIKTAFIHHLADSSLEKGQTARLVFRETRTGSILDIKGFVKNE